MKINYLMIPILTALIAVIGNFFFDIGTKKWHKDLHVIRVAWSIVFVFSAISVLVVWNAGYLLPNELMFYGLLVMINALMSVFWIYLFLYMRMAGFAVIDAAGLGISILALILYTFPISAIAAALLVPYLLWSFFATYLTHTVWKTNR